MLYKSQKQQNVYLCIDSGFKCDKIYLSTHGVAWFTRTQRHWRASQVGKGFTCQFRRLKRHRFNLWVRSIPWSRKWQPTPVFLPGEFHGQRRLADYNPWGHKESDMTEWLNIQRHRNPGLHVRNTKFVKIKMMDCVV